VRNSTAAAVEWSQWLAATTIVAITRRGGQAQAQAQAYAQEGRAVTVKRAAGAAAAAVSLRRKLDDGLQPLSRWLGGVQAPNPTRAPNAAAATNSTAARSPALPDLTRAPTSAPTTPRVVSLADGTGAGAGAGAGSGAGSGASAAKGRRLSRHLRVSLSGGRKRTLADTSSDATRGTARRQLASNGDEGAVVEFVVAADSAAIATSVASVLSTLSTPAPAPAASASASAALGFVRDFAHQFDLDRQKEQKEQAEQGQGQYLTGWRAIQT